ncbi:MAG: 5-oxoprolinase subunit PxpB [Acidobacteriota bacterium]
MVSSSPGAAAWRVTEAGDRALLVRAAPGADPAGRVLGALAALEASRPPEVVDLVPSRAALLVVYEPRSTTCAAVRRWLAARLRGAIPVAAAARELEVPVLYDTRAGLDLETVAAEIGTDVAGVVSLHTGRPYRVEMLGFKPGFPYMAEVDPRLRVPRLPAPRPRVPAGSVAIAGEQTGIYPVACPGGWRVLGRTPWRIFDPSAAEPFRFRPGDRVRFVPIGRSEFERVSGDAEVPK